MGRLGIGDGTRVIAYDDQSGAIASRLWFLLRYFGHETGAILDGGIDAYTQAGHALETSLPEAPSASGAAFRPSPRPELVAERDVVASRSGTPGTLLLDARAPERYRGDVEPIDKRAGHIPSAVNAPFAGNLDAGRFLASETLRELYRALGPSTAGPASPPAMTCSRSPSRGTKRRSSIRARGASGLTTRTRRSRREDRPPSVRGRRREAERLSRLLLDGDDAALVVVHAGTKHSIFAQEIKHRASGSRERTGRTG
jgi:hypothetical protein